MVGFAYRDKYGILHMVDGEQTAVEHGHYAQVNFEHRGGYPIVVVDGVETEAIDYGHGVVYVFGNEGNGKRAASNVIKQLFPIYKALGEINR